MKSANANMTKAGSKRKSAPQTGKAFDLKDLEQVLYGVLMQFANAQTQQHKNEATPARPGRGSAVLLRERMHSYSTIYNAAWFVRFAESSSKEYREQMMTKFWEVFFQELQQCNDIESLTYAVADSLTLYRSGFPWNG